MIQMSKTQKLTMVGIMVAMIYVASVFIHIPIPSPTGMTMIKSGNVLCLVAALLLGKNLGGLAAGLGSMLFDLSNPLYISSAPTTFINFFLMAYIAGALYEKYHVEGKKAIIVSCATGAFSYVLLYYIKSVISSVLLGSYFIPAVIANVTKLGTSLFNATVATIGAAILYPVAAAAIRRFYVTVQK